MSIGSEIMEEHYEYHVIPKYKDLISVQNMYIDFLHSEISKYAPTSKYEIDNKDFRVGQEFRDQIKEVSKKLV